MSFQLRALRSWLKAQVLFILRDKTLHTTQPVGSLGIQAYPLNRLYFLKLGFWDEYFNNESQVG